MARMSPRRLLPALASITLLAAACTGGQIGPSPPSSPPQLGGSPDATNATRTPLLPTSRFALPDFTPGTFQELLGQLKGSPVVVNFWASWCGPCRQEGPGLARVAGEYGRRVQFLGVDLKDHTDAAQIFIRDFGYPYPSVADPQGAIQHSLGFFAQPVTFFLDRDGTRVSVEQEGAGRVQQYSGAIPEGVLRSVVARLASS
jgi:cytochrome c biogenesis protein CcmG/thiol:disulfide interchange protein DsbE